MWHGVGGWLPKAYLGIAVCKQVFGEKGERMGRETGIHAMGYSPATARSLLAMGVPCEESPRLCCEYVSTEVPQLCETSFQRQSSINLISSSFTNEKLRV